MYKRQELGIPVVTELMAKHPERARAVAEITGDRLGGDPFEKVGAQRFVHALARLARFLEETAASSYVFWCAYRHYYILLHAFGGCQLAARIK